MKHELVEIIAALGGVLVKWGLIWVFGYTLYWATIGA